MKLVRLDPPGSWCQYRAFDEMTRGLGAKTFVDVGCGAGGLSLRLCRRGLTGAAADSSEEALAEARRELARYLDNGYLTLARGGASALSAWRGRADLVCSFMVMEHVEDDRGFLQELISLARPGGHVVLGVPARMDKWGPEDETVGHLRRYERGALAKLMEEAGLKEVRVWSLAVPVANLLHGLGNRLTRNTETAKRGQSLAKQTETSGVRQIPFKTVFPPAFRLLLNPWTLYPFFILQRFFYGSGKGLTLLAIGRKKLI